MATGGVAASSGSFLLPLSNIQVTVMADNIIDTSASAIVTGEDNSLEGQGGVSQLLIKTCPKAYKSARDHLKKTTKKFDFGKVYQCHFPVDSTTRGKKLSFNTVLHAIVPSAKIMTNEREWKQKMKVLYYNVLKATETLNKPSLALPLLGSGGAGASIDVAVDVLTYALATFKRDSKPPVHPLKDVIVYVRREAYDKMLSKLDEKIRDLPVLNGVAPPSTKPASASGAKPASARGSSTTQVNHRPASGRGQKSKSTYNPKYSGSKPQTNGRSKPPATHMGASSGASGSSVDPQRKLKASVVGDSKTYASPSDVASNSDDDMSNLSSILSGVTLQNPKHVKPDEHMDISDDEDDINHSGNEHDVDDEWTDEQDDNEQADEDEEEDKCAICLDEMDNPKKLDKCGHTFCKDCIEDSFKHHKPACPTCNTMYGMITGNQPRGTMSVSRNRQGLPGYENCGQIVIDYEFPSGIQGPNHPNPGTPYSGTARRAFLPDCEEGRKVCRLLRVAFENRLIFTIGRSVTTGAENVVTWNDIHHKTRPFGGATGFGYPDPHYLSRIQEELAAKGVTEECLKGRSFDV